MSSTATSTWRSSLAVEARRRDDTPATRGALLTALTHNITSERLRPGASPIDAAG